MLSVGGAVTSLFGYGENLGDFCMRISEQKSWVNIGIISLSRQYAEKSRSYICDEAIEVLLKS